MNNTKITLIALAVAAIFASDANAFGRDKKEPEKQSPAPVAKTAPAAPAAASAPVISAPATVISPAATASSSKTIKSEPAAKTVESYKPSLTPEEIERKRAEAAAKAEAKAKAKADAKAKANADREAKREKETLTWMNANPLNHYQCGEKTSWNRISASGYTQANAPQSVKDLNAKQLNDCQSNIDKLKAGAAEPAPTKTTTETVTEAAGNAADTTSQLFNKFKDSIKKGSTQKTCTQAEQAMGQCR